MGVRFLLAVLIAASFDALAAEIVFCSGFEACTVQQCGNGQLEDPELCDDGNNVDGDGCSANCQSLEVCGNLVTDLAAGEGCDDGNSSGGDGCSAQCQPEYCGNSHLDVGEMCDDGNSVGGDGCSANCQSNETCGNTIVDIAIGEQCDDGNNTSGDGCSASCQPEYCGNSSVDAGEACDDGNNTDGDGCSANCLSDETCGNGIVDLVKGEECDDGNAENGDGCSDACVVECVDGSSRSCSVETEWGICVGIQACELGGWAQCGFAAEVCDYVDNNCDGTVDEGFVLDGKYISDENCGSCGFDCTGWHQNATSFCDVSGTPTCAFQCDSGYFDLNQNPVDGCECLPTNEICDGLDNDCDGEVDEGYLGLGESCTVGLGACQRSGMVVCDASDGQTTVCSATEGVPIDEICDGQDNDCDGEKDEGLVPEACSLQAGVCSGTVKQCGGAVGYFDCGIAEYGPDFEATELTCDNLDNDCDGEIDEELGLGESCGLGACAGGFVICSNGGGVECSTQSSATSEVCNGVDDDCDGIIDEGC